MKVYTVIRDQFDVFIIGSLEIINYITYGLCPSEK